MSGYDRTNNNSDHSADKKLRHIFVVAVAEAFEFRIFERKRSLVSPKERMDYADKIFSQIAQNVDAVGKGEGKGCDLYRRLPFARGIFSKNLVDSWSHISVLPEYSTPEIHYIARGIARRTVKEIRKLPLGPFLVVNNPSN